MTYLQTLDLTLETLDEVLHVAAVEAILFLLFWCARPLTLSYLRDRLNILIEVQIRR